MEEYQDAAGTTVDELYVWYETLSPLQIWQFYLQGGKMAWRVGAHPTMTIQIKVS